MTELANIDLPYIERNKSRHKTMRYYFRIDGKRICRLPDDIDSEEFSIAYWKARKAAETALRREEPAKPIASLTVRPNTFKWLCLAYMDTDAFKGLDDTTQTKRRLIMESMWEEKIRPEDETDTRVFAHMPLAAMDVENLTILRNRKKDTPFAADERLKILRQVFDTARDGKPIVNNVARLVKPYRAKTEGHATATPADLERFITYHGKESKAVLAISMLMFTGFRVSDLAVIGPQHRQRDMFKLRLFKNRNRTPVDIEIAVHPILEGVLNMHPSRGMAYVITEHGKPYSVKGLGNRIAAWFEQAGLPHLTAHSVRKGLATDQAHNEATDSMLEAMFGWKDGKTSKIYTRNAERARLARQAVAKIEWDGIGTKLLASGG